MQKKPPLAAVMTPFPYAIDVEARIAEAAVMMEKHAIHHLPVTAGTEIVGMISARDLADRDSHQRRVREVFTAEPYVVDLGTPLDEVLFTMATRHLGSAIITRHGKLAGIFTTVDACRSFAAFLRELFPPTPDDIVA